MAEKGFVIFTLASRGSYNRGQKFEQATFRNLGKVEIKDQLKGVEYLKSLEFVDPDRMGVYGWSYGGYMSAMLLCKHPETFQVAVSGAPVTHWDGYDTHYTERYMGTPKSNPSGYHEGAVQNSFSPAPSARPRIFR